nr:MAG TPA: Putative transferase, nesg, ydcK, Structural Genomics.38A [Caudoviricetes sp.]
MKKYELTSETKIVFGHILYRIKALSSFGCVSAGDLGGFLESEKNLSQNGDAWVFGNAEVYGSAWVSDNARVSDNAEVYGSAWVSDNAWVYSNARVSGDARVSGNARVSGDAEVSEIGAIFWIGAIGSRNDTATFFRCKDGSIKVVCGCFFGNLDEFAKKVRKTHGDNDHAKVYILAIDMAKIRISTEKEKTEE